MKVLFLTNIPSPYRIDFFNELGKNCELTVTFEKRTSDERDGSWEKFKFEYFNGVFLKGISIRTDTAFCPSIIRFVSDHSFDKIICADFSSLTGIYAIFYMKTMGIKYILESDGGFSKSGKGFKEKIKKLLINGADAYLSTGNENDRYFCTYGAKPERIYRYPFTSVYARDLIGKTLSNEEKLILRGNLGVKEEHLIISVGQFVYRKGFDLLIKAASELGRNIGVYIIGGTPTQEYVNLKIDCKADNIHFVEFQSKARLKEWYQAADCFVLPTREDIWGLVVNEAMGNGLPIITTDKCGAGLELIRDGINGYIFPVDDCYGLVTRCSQLLRDEELTQKMADNSIRIMTNYTIERMAQAHLEFLRCNK